MLDECLNVIHNIWGKINILSKKFAHNILEKNIYQKSSFAL